MARATPLSALTGCLNPLCPSANWVTTALPHWTLELADGQLVEFAACDEACAQMVGRLYASPPERDLVDALDVSEGMFASGEVATP